MEASSSPQQCSTQPHGAWGHPALGLAAQPSEICWFPLELCKASQPKTNPPLSSLLWTAPLTAFFPCTLSLLTLLWHHTLAVLSAATGQQVPSVQHCKKLHCALKVVERTRGAQTGAGVWLPANNNLLPRAWSCASTRRAVDCRWRPSTPQPSW